MKKLYITLIIVAASITGLFVGFLQGRLFGQEAIQINYDEPRHDKLSQVMSMIELEYIDKIPRDSLIEIAIPAILNKLDPHSVYLPPQEFEEAEEPLQGEFDGIGVVFNMGTDTVIVLNVIPSGPSRKAGVNYNLTLIFCLANLV